MTKEQLLSKLQARLETEWRNYEEAGKPGYVRLNRTQFNSVAKKQSEITRRIQALKTAISVLSDSFREVDVYSGILLGICERRQDKEDLLEKAQSIYLNERKEACRELFDSSLPILKKQMKKYLN